MCRHLCRPRRAHHAARVKPVGQAGGERPDPGWGQLGLALALQASLEPLGVEGFCNFGRVLGAEWGSEMVQAGM